jgi:hypothetical protein
MDDKTTTDAPVESGGNMINGVAVDDQGQAIPLPEDNEETTSAAEDTVTTSEDDSNAGAEALPAEDDKLQKFASSHGLDLDSPSAIKAAKMAMDNQAEFQRTRQKASEMEKTMTTMSDESATQVAEQTGQDPEVLKRLQRMEVKDSIREFWDKNPDARNYEGEMAKIAVESGLYGTPDAILKAAYAMARSSDPDALKSQGKREALESLAHKQQAAVPTGNAVTQGTSSASTITPQNVDQLVANNSQEWFEKNYAAINKAMAG